MGNWGVFLGITFGLQVASGLAVVMSYQASNENTFEVLDAMLRDGDGLWVVRGAHSSGSSLVFVFLYAHLLRAIVFGVAPRVHIMLWVSGVLMILVMMGVAFCGYVLPWGLMSFWALTVITNLVSVIPVIGQDILFYIWGGYWIGSITIQRFLCVHYLLPLVLCTGITAHLVFLHTHGSSPTGGVLGCPTDNDHFIVYYYKDVFVLVCGFCVVGCCVFVFSDTLHHSDNFLVVDPLVTPRHIVPEWYFLVWYSVLRCVSSKALGVFLLGFCVVVFLFNAMVTGGTRYAHSSVDIAETSVTLWTLGVLGVLGGCMPVFPFVELSGTLSTLYLAW